MILSATEDCGNPRIRQFRLQVDRFVAVCEAPSVQQITENDRDHCGCDNKSNEGDEKNKIY
jgi:hypothetical protein